MTEITQELLKEFLDYNPETGVLTWKKRDRKWFPSGYGYISWNDRYKDKKAGTVIRSESGKLYRKITIMSKVFFSHRIIWFMEFGGWPEDQIDHIDGDGKNNKLENLRCVSLADNCKNRRLKSTNSSGFAGVSWYKSSSKWVVHIGKDKKWITLGYFKRLSDAVKVRIDAEIEYGYHENHGLERPL